MEPQNSNVLDFLLESINTFLNSSQTLDSNFLSELASLIDDTYNATVNSFRMQRDAMLSETKQSLGWKKYVLNLFQIAYFSQGLSQRLIENILFEAMSTIFANINYGANQDEFIVLLAANVVCLINGNFSPIIKKKYLFRSLENLFGCEIPEKGIISIFASPNNFTREYKSCFRTVFCLLFR